MKMFTRIALYSAIAGSLVACGGDDNDNDDMVRMTIAPTNIEALGNEYNYEGWIIVDGKAVSTGTFDIVNGQTSPSSFSLDEDMANRATTFVLTIEPEVGDVPEPSNVHIIAGDLVNNATTAITNHAAALNTDFSEVAGKFILATPSNGAATQTQGIWYLDNSGGGDPVASLTLPTLPAGWRYEGWVADASGPVTTGTFTTVAGADSDGAGPTAGPNPSPAFPGQDFINPAVVLVGKKAVISVEPNPDNSAAPFSLKPLVGDIADTTALQDLTSNVAATLPSAVITIK